MEGCVKWELEVEAGEEGEGKLRLLDRLYSVLQTLHVG